MGVVLLTTATCKLSRCEYRANVNTWGAACHSRSTRMSAFHADTTDNGIGFAALLTAHRSPHCAVALDSTHATEAKKNERTSGKCMSTLPYSGIIYWLSPVMHGLQDPHPTEGCYGDQWLACDLGNSPPQSTEDEP